MAPLLLALPAWAAAADSGHFLKPADFSGRVGQKVTLQLFSGGLADAALADWPGQDIDWLFIRVAGTQHNMHGPELKTARGGRQSIELELKHAGATMIGMDNRQSARQWNAAEIDQLLERLPADDDEPRPTAGKPARVRHTDSTKILLDVAAEGAPRGHAGVPQSKTGQVAEIRLMADPLHTPVGADLPLRVYLHGSSREGAFVYATSAKSGRARILTTNAAGMANLNVTESGVWMLDCWHVERAKAGDDADWVSYRSTFTFEIPEAKKP
jgi:hypothetical protein